MASGTLFDVRLLKYAPPKILIKTNQNNQTLITRGRCGKYWFYMNGLSTGSKIWFQIGWHTNIYLPLPLLFERRATKLSYKLKVILLKPGFIVNKMGKKNGSAFFLSHVWSESQMSLSHPPKICKWDGKAHLSHSLRIYPQKRCNVQIWPAPWS